MKLRLDEVDTGHLFGNGVLDLDARIAFDEAVLAALRRDEELDRAGVGVVRRLHEPDGVSENTVPEFLVETWRGRGFDDLLVAQLHGAITFVEVEDVAFAVGENLYLDVARTDDQLLDEQIAVAECARRFASATFERLRHGFRFVDHPHSAATTSACGLEHDGIAQFRRHCRGVCRRLHRIAASRNDRDVERRRQGAGANLVAEQRQRGRRRADKRQTGLRAAFREFGVLG